jgi:hypothetical protein
MNTAAASVARDNAVNLTATGSRTPASRLFVIFIIYNKNNKLIYINKYIFIII